jgi:hypothetical protein
VRPGEAPGGFQTGAPSGFRTGAQQMQPPGAQPVPQQQPGFGSGSFLGTAAAAAAGVIGGSMLMNSMGGMFGQRGGGSAQAMTDPAAARESPWGATGGSTGDLGRQAGVDDIGRGGGAERPADQGYGLFDTNSDKLAEANFTDDDIADADFDGGFDLGGDGGGGD